MGAPGGGDGLSALVSKWKGAFAGWMKGEDGSPENHVRSRTMYKLLGFSRLKVQLYARPGMVKFSMRVSVQRREEASR